MQALIRTLVSMAVAVFYRLERRGPPVPPGPAVIAANHPNSLLDPVVVFATAGRTPRPLAKSPLFERRVIGRLIRWLGGIPVYRREDGPDQMARNEEAFRAATAALRAGEAIQVFPEGRSHSDPQLSPLRTGAARIALAAEADAGWSLSVALVPLGLTYARKAFFRGRVVALYGDPVVVADWRTAFERDGYQAARALTEELDRRLRALTLNLTRSEDAALVDVAERLWAREKGLSGAREREPLAERLPRLQAFARGLAWLQVRDPDAFRRLRRDVARYARMAALLGVGEGDVPAGYPLAPTLRWGLHSLLPTVLLAPVAALAAIAWIVPYRLVGWAVERMRLQPDRVATYKLAGALIAYPLFLGLWAALAAWTLGSTGAVAALVGLPALGLVAVRWLDRARDLVEDVRLFARVGGHPALRDELGARRRALVKRFEAERARMEAEGALSDGAAGAPPSATGASAAPAPR